MPNIEASQSRPSTQTLESAGARHRRPGLDRLMKAARGREIDGVLVARFDRFARSTSHLVRALEEFQSLGVEFISLNESVDTSTPMGKMIFTVLGAVAELERNIIIERIKAGVSRARKQDKSLGRPKAIFDIDKVFELHQQGLGVRKIGDLLGVNRETVRKTTNISMRTRVTWRDESAVICTKNQEVKR